MSETELRALMPEDAGAARAVVARLLDGTRYEPRVQEQLAAALAFDDPEHMALLAFARGSARPCGLALFGTVAGAAGVVKLHALLGDDAATCARLAAALQRVARDGGERMIVGELADDAPFAPASAALRERGFVEEGRIADLVADGTALRLLVWRSAATPADP